MNHKIYAFVVMAKKILQKNGQEQKTCMMPKVVYCVARAGSEHFSRTYYIYIVNINNYHKQNNKNNSNKVNIYKNIIVFLYRFIKL